MSNSIHVALLTLSTLPHSHIFTIYTSLCITTRIVVGVSMSPVILCAQVSVGCVTVCALHVFNMCCCNRITPNIHNVGVAPQLGSMYSWLTNATLVLTWCVNMFPGFQGRYMWESCPSNVVARMSAAWSCNIVVRSRWSM